MAPQQVGFLLLPGFSMVTLGAAADLLNSCGPPTEPFYSLNLIGIDGGPVRSSTGFVLLPQQSIREASGFFVVLVVSNLDFAEFYDEQAAAWLRQQARKDRKSTRLNSSHSQ